MIKKYISCVITALIIFTFATNAQEIDNDFQTRISVSAVFEPIKKISLNISPEFRFDENFFLDKYFTEINAEYQPLSFLSVGAGYRFIANTKKTNETEYLHRYSLNTVFKKKFNRFTPSLRICYTNYSDEDDYNRILRFKAKVKYNISKSKITPFLATEAFQSLNSNELYKMRYSTGISYKLFKKNFLHLGYKLDYYLNEYRNKHILSIGNKIKL